MKQNKWNKVFFGEHDDKGGEEMSRGMAAVHDPIPETQPDPTDPTKENEPEEEVAVAPAVVDAQTLAQSLGAVLKENFRPVADEKKVDALTPEEAEKLLNVWKPTKEWITKFGNLETQEDALKELRDGMVKHTDTISQYRIREMQKAMDEKMSPVLSYMQQQQEREATTRFNKLYPQLADDKMMPVIEAVASSLAKKGKKYDDEPSMFKDIASGVEAVIKVNNPNFKLSAGSTPAAKQKGQSSNTIPVTTPGSGGGVGGKGSETPAVKRGLAIFAPVGK